MFWMSNWILIVHSVMCCVLQVMVSNYMSYGNTHFMSTTNVFDAIKFPDVIAVIQTSFFVNTTPLD